MNYELSALVLDYNPSLPLTEDEFLELKHSKRVLGSVFALEEIFDLLVSNYRELESAALVASVGQMTTNKTEYREYYEIRAELNRRTLNLLSAARLYMDQFPQWLSDAGVKPDLAKDKAGQAYDASFEYRFMEALRNYVQHEGMAVHVVELNSKRDEDGQAGYLYFSTSPYASKSALESSTQFKKRVLAECPAKIAIIPAARAYVGHISDVHEVVRQQFKENAKVARAVFEEAIDRHKIAASHKFTGLAAVAINGDRTIERIPILLEWDDVRLKLMDKNRSLSALGKFVVTGQSLNY